MSGRDWGCVQCDSLRLCKWLYSNWTPCTRLPTELMLPLHWFLHYARSVCLTCASWHLFIYFLPLLVCTFELLTTDAFTVYVPQGLIWSDRATSGDSRNVHKNDPLDSARNEFNWTSCMQSLNVILLTTFKKGRFHLLSSGCARVSRRKCNCERYRGLKMAA